MFTACVRKVLTLAIFFLSLTCFSQSPSTPKTLLWRISGKGLQQPSYLYGTMHLQDKRLFQFGDSVYQAIGTTEGLATEIDFQEAMDSIFSNREEEAKKDMLLAREKVKLNRSKLDPSALSLLRKFGVTGNIISKKDLKSIRDYRMQALMQQGEMPTIVDGFLLSLAQRQGKWTGGIEDVNDQLDLRDELGGDLVPDSVLVPEKAFRSAAESMIQLYLARNLDQIDEWCNRNYRGEDRDAMLIRRNVKMARRMDSLSASRSMFFAIGAAHLPGDSGVIRLLRRRGFQVEPVFSSKYISGDEYAAGLKHKEWKEIRGEDSVYTVQMPGQPTDMGKPGEPKMKLFFDLTTMSFYAAGHFYGYDEKTRSLDQAVREGAKNMGGKSLSAPPVSVSQNGLQGKEMITTKDNYTMRLRVFTKGKVLYLLMAGTPKKETINGPDVARFFASFRPGENTPAKKPWKEFSVRKKAFSVRMPGTPEPQKEMDEKSKGDPTWAYTTWHSIDPLTEYYYLMQVREVKAGYTIQNDSALLTSLKDDYRQRLDTITHFEIGNYKGFPAAWMNYEAKKVKGVYKTLHVLRGNRLYVQIGGALRGSDLTDVDSYLQTLDLLPYEAATWQTTGGPGFSTTAPAPFTLSPHDSTVAHRRFFAEYTSQNENDVVSYFVQKSVFSPTYWADSDSTLMEEKISAYKGESDTLLQKTWIENNGYKGLDVLIKPSAQSTFKKIRLLVNKDTLYTVFALVHSRDWETGNHQQFFQGFRLQNAVAPTVYTRKATPLLQAMTTTDSTALEEAMENFEAITFRKEELPLLHKAMLETYSENEKYYGINTKLIERILPLADSSTLRFVKESYDKQTGEKEENKYRLLQLLALLKSKESFALLKPFLLADLPKSGNPIPLQRPLLDTLELSASLFPELLQKADDGLLAPVIAAVADRLLDSSLLTVTQLKKNKNEILNGAEAELNLLQKEVYEPWELIRWARLLSWLNDPEANAFLQRLLRQKDPLLKQAAIIALLKNNQPVPPTEVAKVAADRSQRIYFYDALSSMGKESLFPALYASQKSLAESEVYNLFAEDYDDFTLSYIGQRMAPYAGSRQLFHLFKVRLAYEDDGVKRDYLCVAGPYPVSGKEKLLWGAATGMYQEERYQPHKTDKQFKAYLLSLESTEK